MNYTLNILLVYNHLLADCSHKVGFTIEPPECLSTNWLANEAPQLGKQLLQYIEAEGINTDWPSFPIEFERLASRARREILEASEQSLDCPHLRVLYQLLMFAYKIEYEPTHDQRTAAWRLFKTVDEACAANDKGLNLSRPSSTLRHARATIGKVIYRCRWTNLDCSHGPGAVAPKSTDISKSKFDYYRQVENVYPYTEALCLLPSFWEQALSEADEHTFLTCRLTFVPKDSRGPRLICVHPKEAVWLQQGQRRVLERAIGSSPVTSPYIHFDDQSVNGKLALEASRSREYVTLDLSEASDRLSWGLVRCLFGKHVSRYFGATRAIKCEYLNERIVLKKFAPMGNALTFPVQSLVFFALARAGICRDFGSAEAGRAPVYVFGDDIICLKKHVNAVINVLQMVGLKINHNKTFINGRFRESCGVDAFNGNNITPHRLRKLTLSSPRGALATCQLAKNMRLSGYEQVASHLYSQVRKVYRGLSLTNDDNAQGLIEYIGGSVLTLFSNCNVRFSKRYHRWETQTYLLKVVSRRPKLHDWYHVQDALNRHITEISAPRDLGYPDTRRVRLIRVWTPIILR